MLFWEGYGPDYFLVVKKSTLWSETTKKQFGM